MEACQPRYSNRQVTREQRRCGQYMQASGLADSGGCWVGGRTLKEGGGLLEYSEQQKK